jgi:hypothetical protein
MKRAGQRWVESAALAALVALPGAARGEGAPQFPALQTRPDQMKPGTWVELAVRRSGRPPTRIRMSALRKEGKAQWFEFIYREPTRPKMVFRMLVEGSLAEPKRTRQALLQVGAQPPIAFPPKMLGKRLPAFRRSEKGTGSPSGAQTVGKERIEVGGRMVSAVHHRRKLEGGGQEDSWMSADVPGWPLVKLRRPGLSMDLAGYGSDAKSAMKGKPVELAPSLLEHMDALK